MDRTSKALILEARMILDILHSIVEDSTDLDESFPRREMVHLLYVAKTRLDALDSDGVSLQ